MKEMRPSPGWLKRSLEQARTNIEQRPEHLKPARYREKASTKASKTNRRSRD